MSFQSSLTQLIIFCDLCDLSSWEGLAKEAFSNPHFQHHITESNDYLSCEKNLIPPSTIPVIPLNGLELTATRVVGLANGPTWRGTVLNVMCEYNTQVESGDVVVLCACAGDGEASDRLYPGDLAQFLTISRIPFSGCVTKCLQYATHILWMHAFYAGLTTFPFEILRGGGRLMPSREAHQTLIQKALERLKEALPSSSSDPSTTEWVLETSDRDGRSRQVHIIPPMSETTELISHLSHFLNSNFGNFILRPSSLPSFSSVEGQRRLHVVVNATNHVWWRWLVPTSPTSGNERESVLMESSNRPPPYLWDQWLNSARELAHYIMTFGFSTQPIVTPPLESGSALPEDMMGYGFLSMYFRLAPPPQSQVDPWSILLEDVAIPGKEVADTIRDGELWHPSRGEVSAFDSDLTTTSFSRTITQRQFFVDGIQEGRDRQISWERGKTWELCRKYRFSPASMDSKDSEKSATESLENGYYVFATRKIQEGEVVFADEGREMAVITKPYVLQYWDDEKMRQQFREFAWPISEDGHVYAMWEKDPYQWRPINHSCQPNCVFASHHSLNVIANRNISPGEELTLDYSTFCDSIMKPFVCHCGASVCRKYISLEKKDTELLERYRTNTWHRWEKES